MKGVKVERTSDRDDFVTDSIYSADSHIGYKRLKLANMKIKIDKLSSGYAFNAIFKFKEGIVRESERDLVEKYVWEAEKLTRGYHMTRKLFQFGDKSLRATLIFSKKEDFYIPALKNSRREGLLTGDEHQYQYDEDLVEING